ncbi:MAG: EamA family transporter [Oscillospiraceae bacterium]
MKTRNTAIAFAVLAALCYGISAPISKLLLTSLPPTFMAALLYLGAGLGMLAVGRLRPGTEQKKEAPITKKELPYVIAMVLLDIAAPILLLLGLSLTTPATAALLNNFEIVATTVIALVVFKEAVGPRMWAAIALITLASILLSVENPAGLSFSPGALLVLLACVCWGVENNCTRVLSAKNPLEIVVVKGFGSGLGSLAIALALGQYALRPGPIALALLVGFVAYGLSIYFYILAQRQLGAARTSAYYAFAPFIGAGLSFAIFRQLPTVLYLAAFGVMVAGAYLAATERHAHRHLHPALAHEHRHNHSDGHHTHTHVPPVEGEHSHPHTHGEMAHRHPHTPDLHHTHSH